MRRVPVVKTWTPQDWIKVRLLTLCVASLTDLRSRNEKEKFKDREILKGRDKRKEKLKNQDKFHKLSQSSRIWMFPEEMTTQMMCRKQPWKRTRQTSRRMISPWSVRKFLSRQVVQHPENHSEDLLHNRMFPKSLSRSRKKFLHRRLRQQPNLKSFLHLKRINRLKEGVPYHQQTTNLWVSYQFQRRNRKRKRIQRCLP